MCYCMSSIGSDAFLMSSIAATQSHAQRKTSVGSLLCSRQLSKRIQTCPGARLTTTPCLPIIGWHVTPRDTAEASVRVRRVGSVTDPMRSCGTLGRLNAIKHLTRHGLTLCVDIGGVA